VLDQHVLAQSLCEGVGVVPTVALGAGHPAIYQALADLAIEPGAGRGTRGAGLQGHLHGRIVFITDRRPSSLALFGCHPTALIQ
jgi:hypothetical protein